MKHNQATKRKKRLAEDPDHMIRFNGERFLGPYPDVMPTKSPDSAAK